MKTANTLLIIIGLLVSFSIGFYVRGKETKPTEKQIFLPEEIQGAKEGDSLRVSRVTEKGIYIDYNNSVNR